MKKCFVALSLWRFLHEFCCGHHGENSHARQGIDTVDNSAGEGLVFDSDRKDLPFEEKGVILMERTL